MKSPPTINMNAFTQYCQGEGWVDKRAVNKELGFLNAQTRVETQQTDQLIRSALLQAEQQGLAKSAFQQTLATPQPNFFQQMMATIAQPFQAFARAFQGLAQPILQLPQQLAQLAQQAGQTLAQTASRMMSQILVFFFGTTKQSGRKDDAPEEKAKRDTEDAPILNLENDLFNLKKVGGSQGSGMGSK